MKKQTNKQTPQNPKPTKKTNILSFLIAFTAKRRILLSASTSFPK